MAESLEQNHPDDNSFEKTIFMVYNSSTTTNDICVHVMKLRMAALVTFCINWWFRNYAYNKNL